MDHTYLHDVDEPTLHQLAQVFKEAPAVRIPPNKKYRSASMTFNCLRKDGVGRFYRYREYAVVTGEPFAIAYGHFIVVVMPGHRWNGVTSKYGSRLIAELLGLHKYPLGRMGAITLGHDVMYSPWAADKFTPDDREWIDDIFFQHVPSAVIFRFRKFISRFMVDHFGRHDQLSAYNNFVIYENHSIYQPAPGTIFKLKTAAAKFAPDELSFFVDSGAKPWRPNV